jgi:iron complex outermembrane receptor protein
MKRNILLSFVALSALNAQNIELGEVEVTSTVLKDIKGTEVKSADLSEALMFKVPSINIIRRSGIANDVVLRGQNRDNINVLVDGTKTYGACPNRMDPAISHVLTNNIADIEIVEGPYDVENFGTLSGEIKIDTIKPEKGFHGQIEGGMGSFGYKKGSATLTGGTEKVRALFSASGESSLQYKDGNGRTLAEQTQYNLGTASTSNYSTANFDMDAYDKKTYMAKVYADVADNQELKFSYIANRSNDVMYPNSQMDALWDNSNLYNLQYDIKNINDAYKKLSFQIYKSDVDHPMSTLFRTAGMSGKNEMISHLKTDMRGAKVKNIFDINEANEMTLGLDFSQRKWDGVYEYHGKMAPMVALNGTKSIDNSLTSNQAIFAQLKQKFSNINVKYGLRYDNTHISVDGTQQDNNYNALSANAFATYNASNEFELFGGAGKSSRVPDARELYFKKGAMVSGTDNLKQVTNYEIDLGFKFENDSAMFKLKTFYSWLKDYIYYNASVANNNFLNLDATLYGFEISSDYYATDEIYADLGIAYQRGKKDHAIAGQTNTNLANITPLKGTLGLNYDYLKDSTLRAEVVAASKWSEYDSDNGEQELGAYQILNLKATYALNDSFDFSVGVNNVFDRVYATSNTYKDLILMTSGVSGDVMLINEPGRYGYINATYKF